MLHCFQSGSILGVSSFKLLTFIFNSSLWSDFDFFCISALLVEKVTSFALEDFSDKGLSSVCLLMITAVICFCTMQKSSLITMFFYLFDIF